MLKLSQTLNLSKINKLGYAHIILQCNNEIVDKGREEELVLGLAIALAISALVNLALLINQRTRETILSAGRWMIQRVQAHRANANTSSTFPGPNRDDETSNFKPSTAQTPPSPPPPPPPPQFPQRPAIVWPTVRPSAPPPPPRVLSYGAKGIFETGKHKK